MNGRTANKNIPGDSTKFSKSHSDVEKRTSMRHSQQQEIIVGSGGREKEPREHMNGAKVMGNHYNYNNNSKTNSACINNLILPLLSEVCVYFYALHYLSSFFYKIS